MFEKFKHKKEQNMIREPQGISYLDSKTTDLKTDTLPADTAKGCSNVPINLNGICADKFIGKSSKLKPQNRSKFKELRTIFEGGCPISQHDIGHSNTSKIRYKD